MRNLPETIVNHLQHRWNPRRWSPFPYFWEWSRRDSLITELLLSSPATLQWWQNKFQTNGMLTGWFHGPAHLLWFMRQPHRLRGPSHPKNKAKISIWIERKANKRQLKTRVHQCAAFDSTLDFSRAVYCFILRFLLHLLKKCCIIVPNSCSIFLLWLGREVITLWSGGGGSLISMWMELITNANCNQKGISPPNWEIIARLCC